jgi:hypothetical protein
VLFCRYVLLPFKKNEKSCNKNKNINWNKNTKTKLFLENTGESFISSTKNHWCWPSESWATLHCHGNMVSVLLLLLCQRQPSFHWKEMLTLKQIIQGFQPGPGRGEY